MKPGNLQPGHAVVYDGRRRMVFMRKGDARDEYVFQCDDYRGFDGPDDQGFVTLTGRQIRQQCRRTE